MNKLLDKTTAEIATQIDATDGRFFIPEEGDRRQQTDASVAQLDSMLNLANASGLIEEIRANTSILNRTGGDVLMLGAYLQTAFLESVDELNRLMVKHSGLFVFTLDQNLKKGISLKRSLLDDYGVSADDSTGTLLIVPSAEITGIQTLPYLASGTKYEPALNVRIKTSDNPPISHFDRGGALVQEECPGRWYKFPLLTTSLDLLQ